MAAVYPELVLHDPKTGQPQAVAYHLVNAMLLNEVQKQHRQRRPLPIAFQRREELMSKKQLLMKLALVVLCTTAVLGPAGQSWSDDGFYVVLGVPSDL